MIVTAHQPTYLPWLGLFDKIAQAEAFVLVDVCPMEDSGFENRVKVKTPTGEQWLTVPVRRKRELPLKDVEICADQPWIRKHWRSLELAYHKAPFWRDYSSAFASIYRQRWERLVDLDAALLETCLELLGLARPIVRASALGVEGRKSEMVLDLCRRMHASEYIFGGQGRDYADLPAFERAGITVRFQEYKHPTYPQVGGDGFVSRLSVVDLLFNVGPEALKVLRNGPA